MKKSIWHKNKLVTKEDKDKADRFSKIVFRSILIIVWSVVMILIGMSGGFELGNDIGYNIGHKQGYRDARNVYECDHDRAEFGKSLIEIKE